MNNIFKHVNIKYVGKNKYNQNMFKISTKNRYIVGTITKIIKGLDFLFRCVYCGKFSISDVCNKCKKELLTYEK